MYAGKPTKRFRPRKGPTVLTLFMLAVLLSLGIWQMQRLAWKNNILATVGKAMAASPVPLPEKIDDPAEWQYRRVTMAGWFLHPHEVAVGPRTHEGKAGVYLYTPFRRASGGLVYINRGWVPNDALEKAARPEGLISTEGMVRLLQRTPFAPDNDPGKKQWYWPDIDAMAAASGLDTPVRVYVDATKATGKGGLPVPVPPNLDFPNNHKKYALFWFVMAFALCIVYTVSSFTAAEE